MFGTFSPANLEFTILADIERDWTVFIVILIVGRKWSRIGHRMD